MEHLFDEETKSKEVPLLRRETVQPAIVWGATAGFAAYGYTYLSSINHALTVIVAATLLVFCLTIVVYHQRS